MAGQSEENVLELSQRAFSSPGDPGGFLWNCDCSIWQKEPIWNFGFFSQFQFQVLVGGGTFYANSGSQGHWLRNSGSFRNVTNIFLLVDLGQNWLTTTNLLLFQFHYQLHWIRNMNLCGKEWNFTWLVMLDNKNKLSMYQKIMLKCRVKLKWTTFSFVSLHLHGEKKNSFEIRPIKVKSFISDQPYSKEFFRNQGSHFSD